MVRDDHAMTQLPTFVCAESFSAGETVTLGEDAAHHIRVRRLENGHRVGLLDGRGTRGSGVLVRVAKRHAAVQVDEASSHYLYPVVMPIAYSKMRTTNYPVVVRGVSVWHHLFWAVLA